MARICARLIGVRDSCGRLRLGAAMAIAFLFAGWARADYPIVTTTNEERNWDLACSDPPGTCLAAISSGGFSMIQRVTPGGGPLGGLVFPWGGGIPIYQSAIAHNSYDDTYLLVTWDNALFPWPPYPDPPYRGPGFMAVLVNSLGTPMSGVIRLIEGARYGTDQAPFIRVTFNSSANEYLVTAQVAVTGGGDILGRRVGADGTPLGTQFNITNSPSSFNSHAVAYAPVYDAVTPNGRYLLVWDAPRIYMLDSNGVAMYMLYDNHGQPNDRAIPFEWGSKPGKVYHPDVAFGELSYGDSFFLTFLVVWADYNNLDPYGTYSTEWTGIWGGHVDAELLEYTAPPDKNSTFPISFICQHWANEGTDLWLPRVAFNSTGQRFEVVWRETAADDPCNDTRVSHIRSNYVDYLYRYPPYPNKVISQATGSYPGNEQPLHPAIAASSDGVFVTWDDNRNAGAAHGRDIYGTGIHAPLNDNCSAALPARLGEQEGTLIGASNDGESSCPAYSGAPDVWYSYTAHCAGVLKVSTCGTNDLYDVDGGIDTMLSLHSACPGVAANTLACNDDWNDISGADPTACSGSDAGNARDSVVAYPIASGQTLWIRVSQYNPTEPPGAFKLHLSLEAAPPANDSCINATLFEGNVSQSFCNMSSSTDGPSEPGACSFAGYTQIGSDIWYCWTALCSGTGVVSLCGDADYDTKIAVYEGCNCRSLGPPLACNDDACGLQSEASFPTHVGGKYLIRIGGYHGYQGGGTMSVTCAAEITDCNSNGVDDAVDISMGTSKDCDSNGVPDECQPDADNDGVPDACDNCAAIYNPDQLDSDADDVGTACDRCFYTIPGAVVDAFGCTPEIPGDFNRDGDVDLWDYEKFTLCASGPTVPLQNPGECAAADLHTDGDIDADDFGFFQRCYSGENHLGNPSCLN